VNKLEKAFALFDAYNANDIHQENVSGKPVGKEQIYGQRMTEKLNVYAPDASEEVKLAARCQHIGRWEIARDTFPIHHGKLAEKILSECGYDQSMIDKVKSLLQKKQLHQNPDTQLLEDVICLVFIEFYLDDFAHQHDDEKVIDILKKTLKKMSPRAIEEAVKIRVTDHVKSLIGKAAAGG
jgi:hypothetical protein